MKKSRAVALSAVLSALGVVLLFIGSASQVLDLSCAALASIITVFAVIELKGGWPFLIYAVTSALSLLLLPDKFAALIYLLFAGYYPMLKNAVEKLRKPVIEWIIKLAVFNAALTGVVWASREILKLPDDELIGLTWAVYLLGNAVFALYDVALTRLISLYLFNLRKRFKFLNK